MNVTLEKTYPEDNSNQDELLMGEPRTRCEVWSRVMGYFRPVESWNIGKKQEYAERTPFLEARATEPSVSLKPDSIPSSTSPTKESKAA